MVVIFALQALADFKPQHPVVNLYPNPDRVAATVLRTRR